MEKECLTHDPLQLLGHLESEYKNQFSIWLTADLASQQIKQQLYCLFFEQIQARNPLFKHLELQQKIEFFAWVIVTENLDSTMVNKKLGYLFFEQIQSKRHGIKKVVKRATLSKKSWPQHKKDMEDAGAGFEPAASGL